jgi:hypothetical protein
MKIVELTEYTTHKVKVKNEEFLNTFDHYKNNGWDLVDSYSAGEGVIYLEFSKPVDK